MKPMNQIVIIADEHAKAALGCYGHPFVKTPNLDALAARGVRFTDAYCNSPLCVPSRASMHTGRPVHEIGCWDNAHPYLGEPKGWAHRLRDAGRTVVSVGKLHFRNETDDTGFTRQIVPMHLVDGTGQVGGLLRDPLPPPRKSSRIATEIGFGETTYQRYDRSIADQACLWIEQEAPRLKEPFTLFVSFVCPHPPYKAPAEFQSLYEAARIPPPKGHRPGDPPLHPWIAALRNSRNDDDFFNPETRSLAIAAYFALCTFVDDQIGRVLSALDKAGLDQTTRIIYTSDHGEMLGSREVWGKMCLYEESMAIPLIISAPDLDAGQVCRTPVSLLDLYPTILEGAGVAPPSDFPPSRRSLWHMATSPLDHERAVFGEYHGQSSPSGAFMLRKGRFKLIFYVGFSPELFDLKADPEELHDLSRDRAFEAIRRELEDELRRLVDPEAVDRRAKDDQLRAIERHGGAQALSERGIYQGTPVPGERPVYVQ